MKVSLQDAVDTAHLSVREAAKVLGVGKSSVGRAREKYALTVSEVTGNVFHNGVNMPRSLVPEKPIKEIFVQGGGLVTPGGSPAGTYETPTTLSEAAQGDPSHVSIETDMSTDKVSESTHRLSYAYSEWDMPDGRVGRSRRVTAVPTTEVVEGDPIDPHALLKEIRKETQAIPPLRRGQIDSTFVVSLNDWQFGKKTLQGGTADTIRIVTEAVHSIKGRLQQLANMGYGFSELIIIFGGDIIEGCANTPQGAYGIEMAQRQQIEGAVALGLMVLDELAPCFPKVQVLAVRGNHGENRINGGRSTTPEDNNDTLVASIIRTAAERDEKLKHVEFTIAEDEAGVWTQTVTGWMLGTTHGDVYGKGVSGATTERKVNTWYKNMSATRDPLGNVDVLITHHYHHSQSADYGAWEWHQTPAQDGALSEYFRQSSGNYSEPGVLTFVMADKRYMEEKIV